MKREERLRLKREREHGELLALFAAQNSAVHAFQERQWKATNYGLLLLAAILPFSQVLRSSAKELLEVSAFAAQVINAALYLTAGYIWARVWRVLDDLEESISKERHCADIVIFSLSATFQKANYPPQGNPPEEKERTTQLPLFRAVLTIGFLAISTVIFFNAGGT